MGLGRALTDRIRRLSGTDEDGLVEAWRQLALPALDADELTPAAARTVTELRAKVDALGGAAPSAALRRELIGSLRAVAAGIAKVRGRCTAQVESGRGAHRQLCEARLRLSHLEDEIARCRTAVEHEVRRRNLRPVRNPDDGLHEELVTLFRAISATNSRRMQTVVSDPVLTELESLIGAADDPHVLDRIPAWLQQPARRLIELVRERQRYRRMLAERGLLPQ